ncbi:Os03g0320875, partial [Oryza sativa Japonica Group]
INLDIGISSKAMTIINSFINDIFKKFIKANKTSHQVAWESVGPRA